MTTADLCMQPLLISCLSPDVLRQRCTTHPQPFSPLSLNLLSSQSYCKGSTPLCATTKACPLISCRSTWRWQNSHLVRVTCVSLPPDSDDMHRCMLIAPSQHMGLMRGPSLAPGDSLLLMAYQLWSDTAIWWLLCSRSAPGYPACKAFSWFKVSRCLPSRGVNYKLPSLGLLFMSGS